MDLPKSQTARPNSDAKPSNKRRRKKSMVWDHFTIETINPNCIRASCNQCKKSFAYISGEKLAGTSHLKRHIALGICPVGRHNKEKDQLSPYASTPRTNISANSSNLQRKRYRAANGVASVRFNGSNNNSSHELAKMIIQHDYPLHMVEHTGFIDFARSLHPQFNITSVGTVQEQIMSIYRRDKQKLMDLLSGIPGRINLTMDLRTSSQSLDYVLLTGHFTDRDWKLQRRVFNFSVVQFPDFGTAFNGAISSCLNDWSLEGKIFTITLDRSYANLRNLLSFKNPIIPKGQLIIGCYACLLRSLAQDAIGSMRETVKRVRHSVKYIKTSDAHEERFNKLKQLLQVPSTKKLTIDDLTKWDTTYDMLTAACEVKQVFSCLDTSDPDYKSTPSMEEWRQVEILCTFLKIFYEAASKLTSSPVYPTANLFFREASDIHLELMHAAWSHDLLVSALIKPLHERFTKYWEDNYLVLAIAAIVDPRFKAELVESKFSCIYGKDAKNWTAIVRENLRQLFVEYEGNENLAKTEVPHDDILLTEGDDLLNFDLDISDFMGEPHIKSELDDGYLGDPVFHQPNTRSELDQHLEDPVFHQPHTRSELDQHLEDPVFHEPHTRSELDQHIEEPVFHGPHPESELDRHLEQHVFHEQHMKLELNRYLDEPVLPYVHELDVIGWWKMYRSKYPVLSRLACDVLSVPFSTIPPEYVFDTRERRVDNYQSSLCPRMLEALVCAKDWLQYDSAESQFGISSEITAATVKTEL